MGAAPGVRLWLCFFREFRKLHNSIWSGLLLYSRLCCPGPAACHRPAGPVPTGTREGTQLLAMKEAGPTKPPPRRSRLGAKMAELLGCTALLFLLCWSTWDVQVPSLCSRSSAARAGGGGWRRHRWVLVDGTEPAAATASPPATCRLDVDQGPIAEVCHLISDVCMDQVGRGCARWELGGLCHWTRAGSPWAAQAAHPHCSDQDSALTAFPATYDLSIQLMVVLYGQEYFRPLGAPRAPAALPLLEPSHRHSHFRYTHKGTVRCILPSLSVPHCRRCRRCNLAVGGAHVCSVPCVGAQPSVTAHRRRSLRLQCGPGKAMLPLLTAWPQGANVYHSLPPLQFRVASTEEPTPYLQEPVFSSCTVPVIHYR